MLEFILVIFILITSCVYLLAFMEIRKINHAMNSPVKGPINQSTKTQVPVMNSSTPSPSPNSTTSKQHLSFNRDKLFAGTFSDRHAITEHTLSKKNSIQLMMQQIIKGTSLDDSTSTGETSNSPPKLENKPAASTPIQAAKQPKKMTFVADPSILKDINLLFDEDMDKLLQLNKTAKRKRQK